jgi:hypothetical protein
LLGLGPVVISLGSPGEAGAQEVIMFRTTATILLLSIIGCTGHGIPPVPDVRGTDVDITTDAALYRTSDSVSVTVHNRSGRGLHLNLCPATLERWTGIDWAPVTFWPGPGKATCIMLGGDVASGGTFSARFALLTNVPPGQYRIEFPAIEIGNPLPIEDRVTHVFTVGS